MNLLRLIVSTVLLLFVFNSSKVQLGLSYHQYLDNNLVGINYEINKFRPEFRFGVKRILVEIAVEIDSNYQIIKTKNSYYCTFYSKDSFAIFQTL